MLYNLGSNCARNFMLCAYPNLAWLGESVSVGAEMASEANLCLKGSGAVWTGDGGMLSETLTLCFSSLACIAQLQQSCWLMVLCATAYRCLPLWSVHSCLFPQVVADAKSFQ